MNLKYMALGLALFAGIGAAPIVPQNMHLAYSYEETCAQALNPDPIPAGREKMYDPQYIPATCTGSVIDVAVFKDDGTNIVFKEIPHALYVRMGQRDGFSQNPAKSELVSPLQVLTQKASAAVAFDTSTLDAFSGGSVASITFSHTMGTGANGMLTVFTFQDQGFQADNSSGATYNSVAMTKVKGQTGSGSGFTGGMAAFVLPAPSTGANNVVVSFTPNTRSGAIAGSYTGVNQSTTIDGSASGAPSGGNLTATVTVASNNAWTVLGAINDGGATVTAGTGTTLRQAGGSGDNLADSNGPLSTGSKSLILNSSNNRWTYIILSLAPVFVPPETTATKTTVNGVKGVFNGVKAVIF